MTSFNTLFIPKLEQVHLIAKTHLTACVKLIERLLTYQYAIKAKISSYNSVSCLRESCTVNPPICGTNSSDTDQTQQNKASDKGLKCLLTEKS